MGLVEERNSWSKDFDLNGRPSLPILEDYETNRGSEFWRASRQYEMMCEYILYLERKASECGNDQ